MKIPKQARREGKELFRLCFREGRLDEGLVRENIRRVIEQRPRNYLAALTHFQRLLKLYLESRRARVVNAVESSPQLMQSIQSALTKRYGPDLDVTYWIDPQLLGGLRIRVGSDVYDGSIQARLQELKASF